MAADVGRAGDAEHERHAVGDEAADAVPTRKNLSAASDATSSRFRKPVSRKSGIDISSKATKSRTRSRAEARTSIPSSDTSSAK
jgi:hypothetical protein